jgi:hypothetical protein
MAFASIAGPQIPLRIMFTLFAVAAVAVACSGHVLMRLDPGSLSHEHDRADAEDVTSKMNSLDGSGRPLLQADSEPPPSPRESREAVALTLEDENATRTSSAVYPVKEDTGSESGVPEHRVANATASSDVDSYLRTSVLGPTLQPAPKRKVGQQRLGSATSNANPFSHADNANPFSHADNENQSAAFGNKELPTPAEALRQWREQRERRLREQGSLA